MTTTDHVRTPIYSPIQVGASTFLAGPIGGTHLLWKNFNALGQPREAKIILIAGVSFTFVLWILAFTTNVDRHLWMAFDFIIALSGRFIADVYQLKKEAIVDSTEYTFQSNWKVFGISVAWLTITLLIIVLVMVGLSLVGIDIE